MTILFWILYPGPCILGVFSIVLDPVWALGIVLPASYQGSFPAPSFLICITSQKTWGETADLWSSSYTALSSAVLLPVNFRHVGLPEFSTVSSLRYFVCWTMFSFSLALLQPGNLFQAVTWGIYGTHLIYFSSQRITVLRCLCSISKNYCFLFVHFFSCFKAGESICCVIMLWLETIAYM